MKLNEIFDRVAVINLDKRTDRMEEFDRQAKEIGLEYIRYSAVEAIPKELRPTDACRLSHLQVLQDAVNDGVQRLFVFEDDAQFKYIDLDTGGFFVNHKGILKII